MKVKDLIKQLSELDPDETIVMKNLQANPLEDQYVLTKIRVYNYKGQAFIDGYDKKFV